jgi:hypothetical protein
MPGDGSAFDTSRINILKRIYNHIQSVNPAAYMICEHFGPNAEEKILANYGLLLWGNSNYNYNEATMGYLNNSDFSWVSYQARGWSNPNLVSYMESHDEERLMYKNIQYGNSSGTYNIKDIPTALKRQELAGAFFFTIPGPKMIWQFGELGYDVSIDFNGRVGVKPVKWDYLNQDDRKHLYLVWAKLIDLRKNYPVFRTNDYTLNVGTNVAMKSIILRDSEEDAVVIGNFGLTSGTMQPGFTSTGWWYELFTGDSLNITDINASVSLYPGEYRIYATKKLESVITATDKILYQDIEVYPNPAMNWLYVNLEKTANAQIYNLSGVMVKQFTGLHKGDSLDISNLPDGFYTVRLLEGNRVRTAKFMKKH